MLSDYIESETLELKEKYTDVICKEIVSFLNASGGTIIIGVKDDGTIVGVQKIDETLKKISDIITMQIEPNPQDEIRSELKFEAGKTLIWIYTITSWILGLTLLPKRRSSAGFPA